MIEIDYKLANKYLRYDPDSGEIYWKRACKRNTTVGDIATHLSCYGYLAINMMGGVYLAHRLAWLIYYREPPQAHLDHINHIRTDNAISNLREAGRAINSKNLSLYVSNKSGVPGVCWHSRDNTWVAQIKVNKTRINLGSFPDWFDAVCAKKSAENKYGFHPNHGK